VAADLGGYDNDRATRLTAAPDPGHIIILDGWRACSILCVLAGHLFPLGPKAWGLNGSVAASGMALFFILSGFLITSMLSNNPDIGKFLKRRIVRILPLAWLAMAVILPLSGASLQQYLANFLFFANLPPAQLLPAGAHLWSLCVEMQFYAGIALLVTFACQRGLFAIPGLCVGVTLLRMQAGATIDIATLHRVDEILAGGILALGYLGRLGIWPKQILSRLNPLFILPLLLASAHPAFGPLNYARPYFAMLTIGASLYACPYWLKRILESRVAGYIATISYALYVVHAAITHSWLGSGDKIVKYAKRPLLLAVTFAVAHLSTFYFEQPLIRRVKRGSTGAVKISAE
jgi:peptidoglycan/LPS O-acetylase OafA/YrhL